MKFCNNVHHPYKSATRKKIPLIWKLLGRNQTQTCIKEDHSGDEKSSNKDPALQQKHKSWTGFSPNYWDAYSWVIRAFRSWLMRKKRMKVCWSLWEQTIYQCLTNSWCPNWKGLVSFSVLFLLLLVFFWFLSFEAMCLIWWGRRLEIEDPVGNTNNVHSIACSKQFPWRIHWCNQLNVWPILFWTASWMFIYLHTDVYL